MTNVSLRSFSFSFSLQVMKAPALTSNNSVWELTSKTTINCNPCKVPFVPAFNIKSFIAGLGIVNGPGEVLLTVNGLWVLW